MVLRSWVALIALSQRIDTIINFADVLTIMYSTSPLSRALLRAGRVVAGD